MRNPTHSFELSENPKPFRDPVTYLRQVIAKTVCRTSMAETLLCSVNGETQSCIPSGERSTGFPHLSDSGSFSCSIDGAVLPAQIMRVVIYPLNLQTHSLQVKKIKNKKKTL